MDNNIVIETEQGKLECTVIATFPLENKRCIALMDNTDNIILLFYCTENDEMYELYDIEDEIEYKKATEEFDRLINSQEVKILVNEE